ncbi:MAG: serine hydrolase, partial [Bacteroidota bacterium]
MKRILTPALIIFLVAVLGFGIFIRLQYWSQLPVANGYAAKMMCSYHFIADREAAAIQQEDLGAPPLSLTKTVIDESAKTATTSLFGFSPRVAAYREGVGCILIDGKDDHGVSLSRPDIALRRTPDDPPIDAFSEVNGVDYGRLHRAVELAFDPSRQMDSVMTRAVVVIYKDSMIIESYAKGIDKNTELLGWSMTKSITSAMIGILIKQGQLNLDQRSLFDTWTDERSEITLRHMLQMQSGLAFEEDYATLSDATKMLFTSEDIAEIPLQSQLEYEPGTHWYYSSGTTNLLSHLIRETIGDQQAYLEFPYTELFEKLG